LFSLSGDLEYDLYWSTLIAPTLALLAILDEFILDIKKLLSVFMSSNLDIKSFISVSFYCTILFVTKSMEFFSLSTFSNLSFNSQTIISYSLFISLTILFLSNSHIHFSSFTLPNYSNTLSNYLQLSFALFDWLLAILLSSCWWNSTWFNRRSSKSSIFFYFSPISLNKI